MTKRPTAKVLRRDLDGSTIVQQPLSIMFQVYFQGKFMSALPRIDQAHRLLNKLQGASGDCPGTGRFNSSASKAANSPSALDG